LAFFFIYFFSKTPFFWDGKDKLNFVNGNATFKDFFTFAHIFRSFIIQKIPKPLSTGHSKIPLKNTYFYNIHLLKPVICQKIPSSIPK